MSADIFFVSRMHHHSTGVMLLIVFMKCSRFDVKSFTEMASRIIPKNLRVK